MNEARKRANVKWDKENMTTLACRVTKVRAQAFREACAALATLPSRVFQEAIDRTIAEADKKTGE